jgi:hypothetical protein
MVPAPSHEGVSGEAIAERVHPDDGVRGGLGGFIGRIVRAFDREGSGLGKIQMLTADTGVFASVNSGSLLMEHPVYRAFVFEIFLVFNRLLEVVPVLGENFCVCLVIFIGDPKDDIR